MKTLGYIVAVVLALYVGFKVSYPTVSLRYRLTLEVEHEGQKKVGSGAIEANWTRFIPFGNNSSNDLSSYVRGQAVWIDLGPTDAVFVLLADKKFSRSKHDADSIVPTVFNMKPASTLEFLNAIAKLNGERDVPPRLMPTIVRFRDVNNPKAVELIDPEGLGNSVSSDVRIVSVKIEIVGHSLWLLNSFGISAVPITRGILERLPWLETARKYGAMRVGLDGPPRLSLDDGDFIQGDF